MELLRPCNDAAFAAQTTTYTGTAGTLTGWPEGPQGVLVWCTTDAYIRVGVGVTATTSDTPIPAYTPVPIGLPRGTMRTGAPWTVSAIQVSTGGSVYAKPINIE